LNFKGAAMKSKIISSILISSLLIQITLTGGGCMTFLPVEDKNLAHHQEDENTLLVKLKDKRDIEVEPENLIYYGNDSLFIYGKGYELNLADTTYKRLFHFNGFVSPAPAKIDSEKVIKYDSSKYYLFWMNNNKRISIKEDDLVRFSSNTMDNYWVTKSENMGYQQFYAKDIAAIEEKGLTDKAKVGRTVFGVLSGIGLMIYFVLMFKNIPD
jgi:hypothetical protein